MSSKSVRFYKKVRNLCDFQYSMANILSGKRVCTQGCTVAHNFTQEDTEVGIFRLRCFDLTLGLGLSSSIQSHSPIISQHRSLTAFNLKKASSHLLVFFTIDMHVMESRAQVRPICSKFEQKETWTGIRSTLD